MSLNVPYDKWQPLSVNEVVELFANAPFKWALAGGYAVEQFLGSSIREHSDIDIVIYRDEQLNVQHWLKQWELYAADPPGVLRKWRKGEYLRYGIHDIWGHQTLSTAWQLQIMLAEVEGNNWFCRRNPMIRGHRDDLITEYNGIPCVRIEVQLMYKSKDYRPKDELDFQTCLPKMSVESRKWLERSLAMLYPQGHAWLDALS